ncbi:MAG: hypothetical protein LBM66_07400, partial [Bifidobacteriaceae bacterium]|nr:hypothetical protein [Bifidobacteriaceae bacterium]
MSSSSSSDDPTEPGTQERPASCDEPAAPAVPTTPATPATPTEPAGPAGQNSAGRGGPAEHPVEDDGPTPSELDKLGDGTTVRSVLNHVAEYVVDHDLLGEFSDFSDATVGPLQGLGDGAQGTAYGVAQPAVGESSGPRPSVEEPPRSQSPWDRIRNGLPGSGFSILVTIVAIVMAVGAVLTLESHRSKPVALPTPSPSVLPVSAKSAAATLAGSVTPGVPSVSAIVSAYDVLGPGWIDYEVGPSPAAGSVVVYGTTFASATAADFRSGRAKSAELAEVSLADAHVIWRARARDFCGASAFAFVEDVDVAGSGETVVQLKCESGKSQGAWQETATIGPTGQAVSQLRESAGGTYLGTAAGVTGVADRGQVEAYRSNHLADPVWQAAASASPGQEVVDAGGGAIDVWTDGGYRDLASGKAAGFGGNTAAVGSGYGFVVAGGQVFETGPAAQSGAKALTLWTVGADKAAWTAPVILGGGRRPVVAGGQVVAVAASGEAASITAHGVAGGAVTWTYRPADGARIVDVGAVSAVSGVPARFAVVETDGVVWLDAASGQVVARVAIAGVGADATDVPTPDGLAVVTAEGLVGVSPDGGGKVAWTVPLGGAMSGATIAER